jgi:hypothetical protein
MKKIRSDGAKKPSMVQALCGHGITHISCGVSHSLACTATGRLFVWGSNQHGQLGADEAVLAKLRVEHFTALEENKVAAQSATKKVRPMRILHTFRTANRRASTSVEVLATVAVVLATVAVAEVLATLDFELLWAYARALLSVHAFMAFLVFSSHCLSPTSLTTSLA